MPCERFSPIVAIIHLMACRVRCDSCDLDRRLEDCVSAHRIAKEHEAAYGDHFVSLQNPA
jgi:hypothetical protein